MSDRKQSNEVHVANLDDKIKSALERMVEIKKILNVEGGHLGPKSDKYRHEYNRLREMVSPVLAPWLSLIVAADLFIVYADLTGELGEQLRNPEAPVVNLSVTDCEEYCGFWLPIGEVTDWQGNEPW